MSSLPATASVAPATSSVTSSISFIIQTAPSTNSAPQSTIPVEQNMNPINTSPAPNVDFFSQMSVNAAPYYPVNHSFSSHLPKLNLPVFNGDPLKWLTFWDSFNVGVNSKPGLPEVGKFNYLKAQVTGEAEHVPITSGNYARAIATLKERFGHPDKVANAHMTALLDLPHPTSHQPSLRSFYDTLETNIRAPEAPAKSQDTFADLLVPVIWAKLPEETKCNLAWSQQGDYWTIEDLGEVLREPKVLEAGTTSLLEPTPTAPFFARVGGSHPRGKGGTKSQSCPYCRGSHGSLKCVTVKDFTSKNAFTKAGLCDNCVIFPLQC